MWDTKRKVINGRPQIDGILIHHTAGNRCQGWSATQVFQSLNRVGFERGYKKYGYDFESGLSKRWGQNRHTCMGQISYCEYHYAIWEYEPGQYAIVSLIDDPEWTDAGSVWKKEINQVAVAFAFCGNWEENDIPEGMIEYFIKLFRKAAPCAWVLKMNPAPWVKGHRDTGDATACPGVYLHTYIPRIEREIKSLEV